MQKKEKRFRSLIAVVALLLLVTFASATYMTYASRWFGNQPLPGNNIVVDNPQVVTVAGTAFNATLFPVDGKGDLDVPAGVTTVAVRNLTLGIVADSALTFDLVIKDLTFGGFTGDAIDSDFMLFTAGAEGTGVWTRDIDAWECDNGVPCTDVSPCQVWDCVNGTDCTGLGDICQVWDCENSDIDCEDGNLGSGCTTNCDWIDDACGDIDDDCGDIDDDACGSVPTPLDELTFAQLLAYIQVEVNGATSSLTLVDDEMVLVAGLDATNNGDVVNVQIWISDAAPYAIAGAVLAFTFALVVA